MTSQEFAGYAITRRLAAGGMTYLYLGVNRQQERVVIRRMRPEFLRDRRLRTSFINGGEILARLDHANVVRLIEAGIHHDEPYQVLEYIESHPLRDLVAQRHPLLRQNPLSMMRQIAAGLSYIHLAGFLHLDLKPDNILMRADGLAVIVDFDLALPRKHLPIKLSPLPGTFAYLPPETIGKGLVDDQTDIYAFGVTCYEMLTGHKPFEGVTPEDSRRMQLDPTAHPRKLRLHNVTVPPAMENLIFKCLAHPTIARYPSMSLVLRDLEAMI